MNRPTRRYLSTFVELFAIFIISINSNAATTRLIRGVEFDPLDKKTISNIITIKIPHNWERLEISNGNRTLEVYQDSNQSFTTSITFTIIKGPLSFDDSVREARENDFGKEKIAELHGFYRLDQSAADKKIVLFGTNPVSGNSMCAIYYYQDIQCTIRVTCNIIYTTDFSDNDWNYIMTRLFEIYGSIRRAGNVQQYIKIH